MPHPQQSAMQGQPCQNPGLNNLQKFLSNYNKFIAQNSSIQTDSETILNDIALNIMQPPRNLSQQSEQLYQLYVKGKQLPQMLTSSKENEPSLVQEMSSRLKKLKEDKTYETIMFIEQLNYSLNKEYQFQVNRGIENGVYTRRQNNGAEGIVGSHKTQGLSCSAQNVKLSSTQKIGK